MANATQIGTAGLQGWRAKVGDVVAAPLASRTPLEESHVRAIIGATFLTLSVVYVAKSIVAAARQ